MASYFHHYIGSHIIYSDVSKLYTSPYRAVECVKNKGQIQFNKIQVPRNKNLSISCWEAHKFLPFLIQTSFLHNYIYETSRKVGMFRIFLQKLIGCRWGWKDGNLECYYKISNFLVHFPCFRTFYNGNP